MTRVVLIEDNLVNVMVLERMLRRLGTFDIHAERTGRAGVSTAVAVRPHIVFVDFYLRYTTGAAVVRELRATPALRTTPAVVVSADRHLDRELFGRDANVYFMPKPIEIDALAATLDRALPAVAPRP